MIWIETLIERLTCFIPRVIIIRPDEGGFRSSPKPWAGWPWAYWPWIRWSWIKRPWTMWPWSPRDNDTGTWVTDLKPGNWYWLIPLIMEQETCKIKTQVKDIRTQSIWTADGVDIIVGVSIRYYIRSWMKATLEVQDYDQSLQTVALMKVCDYVENHTLKELREKTEELKGVLLDEVKTESKGWGLQIQDIGKTDIGRARNIRLLGESSFGNSMNA